MLNLKFKQSTMNANYITLCGKTYGNGNIIII